MSSKPALTPQEQMKEYKREIDRACRELDRARRKCEMDNNKIATEMKAAAAKNQMGPVKSLAMTFARTKKQIQKFHQLRAHLQGVGSQLQTMKGVDAMANAMKNTASVMKSMSQRLNMPQLTAVMRTFAVESDRMEGIQEFMGDQLDSVLDDDEVEEEADSIVSQVMAELSIKMAEMPHATPALAAAAPVAAAPLRQADAVGGGGGPSYPPPPSGGPGGGAGGDGGGGAAAPVAPPPAAAPTPAASDLAARLNNLKK